MIPTRSLLSALALAAALASATPALAALNSYKPSAIDDLPATPKFVSPPEPETTKTRMLGGPDTKRGFVSPPEPDKSRRGAR